MIEVWPKPMGDRHHFLQEMKKITIEYMQTKIQNEDWHGVADAAMDIRDFEAEMKGLELAIGSL